MMKEHNIRFKFSLKKLFYSLPCYPIITVLLNPTKRRTLVTRTLGFTPLDPRGLQAYRKIKLPHLQLVLLQRVRPTRGAAETMMIVIDAEEYVFASLELMWMLGFLELCRGEP